MVKKILKFAGWVVLSAFVAGICYFLFVGAWMNDFRARRIERDLAGWELPADTELVEVTSFVGNTSGTGNHVEIWAGALIHSTLSEAELEAYFAGRAQVSAVPQDLVAHFPYNKDFMDFHALEGVKQGDGYFVIGNYYEAFTQIDLRGH